MVPLEIIAFILASIIPIALAIRILSASTSAPSVPGVSAPIASPVPAIDPPVCNVAVDAVPSAPVRALL